MASSSTHETTGFEIQTKNMHKPPEEGLNILYAHCIILYPLP